MELSYSNDSVLMDGCEEVENFCRLTRWQMTGLDWLVYHAQIRVCGPSSVWRNKSYL